MYTFLLWAMDSFGNINVPSSQAVLWLRTAIATFFKRLQMQIWGLFFVYIVYTNLGCARCVYKQACPHSLARALWESRSSPLFLYVYISFVGDGLLWEHKCSVVASSALGSVAKMCGHSPYTKPNNLAFDFSVLFVGYSLIENISLTFFVAQRTKRPARE